MSLVLAKGKNDLTLDPLQSLYMYFNQQMSQNPDCPGDAHAWHFGMRGIGGGGRASIAYSLKATTAHTRHTRKAREQQGCTLENSEGLLNSNRICS